jgi:hypothetical protein
MGKKKPLPQPWTVHLESVYRPDRDERIAKAYELALPMISNPILKVRKEATKNESASSHRHLRSCFQ